MIIIIIIISIVIAIVIAVIIIVIIIIIIIVIVDLRGLWSSRMPAAARRPSHPGRSDVLFYIVHGEFTRLARD